MSRHNVVRRFAPYFASAIGWLIGLAAMVFGFLALLTPGERTEGMVMFGLGWVTVLVGGIAAVVINPAPRAPALVPEQIADDSHYDRRWLRADRAL